MFIWKYKLSQKPGFIFFSIPLIVLIILRFLGFDGMSGQDSYAYVDYAKMISDGLKNGNHPGDFFWPAGYPLLGALLKPFAFTIDLSLQLICVASISATLYFIHKLLVWQHGPQQKNIILGYLLLFGLFSPYFLRHALLTMSDLPAAFMLTCGIYFAHDYVQKGQFRQIALATTCLVYSSFIRFPAGIIALPFLLWLVASWIKHGYPIRQLLVLLIPTIIVALYFYFKAGSFVLTDRSWSLNYLFTNSLVTREGITKSLMPPILMVFSPFAHYGFMLPGMIFIIAGFQKLKSNRFLWLVGFAYLFHALFVGSYEGFQKRHLLTAYPLVLIICVDGFITIYNLINNHFRRGVLFMVFGLQFFLCLLAFKGVFRRTKLERHIAHDMQQKFKNASPATPILYGFDIDIALKSRGVPADFRNFWMEDYKTFETGAYVIFNERQLKDQWQGTRVMQNWDRLNELHELKTEVEYPQQWYLYHIGPVKGNE